MVFSVMYLLHPYSEQRTSKPPSSPHKFAMSAVCFLTGFQENGSAPLASVISVLPSHLSHFKGTRCILAELSFVYRVCHSMLWRKPLSYSKKL